MSEFCGTLIIVSSDGFVILRPVLLALPPRHLGARQAGCWEGGGLEVPRQSDEGRRLVSSLTGATRAADCAADPAFFFSLQSETLC